MTTGTNCNCIVCAQEFDTQDLQSVALSEINVTNFKICQACLDNSDPAEDYSQVKNIIESYLHTTVAKSFFKEASSILNDLSSKKK